MRTRAVPKTVLTARAEVLVSTAVAAPKAVETASQVTATALELAGKDAPVTGRATASGGKAAPDRTGPATVTLVKAAHSSVTIAEPGPSTATAGTTVPTAKLVEIGLAGVASTATIAVAVPADHTTAMIAVPAARGGPPTVTTGEAPAAIAPMAEARGTVQLVGEDRTDPVARAHPVLVAVRSLVPGTAVKAATPAGRPIAVIVTTVAAVPSAQKTGGPVAAVHSSGTTIEGAVRVL